MTKSTIKNNEILKFLFILVFQVFLTKPYFFSALPPRLYPSPSVFRSTSAKEMAGAIRAVSSLMLHLLLVAAVVNRPGSAKADGHNEVLTPCDDAKTQRDGTVEVCEHTKKWHILLIFSPKYGSLKILQDYEQEHLSFKGCWKDKLKLFNLNE